MSSRSTMYSWPTTRRATCCSDALHQRRVRRWPCRRRSTCSVGRWVLHRRGVRGSPSRLQAPAPAQLHQHEAAAVGKQHCSAASVASPVACPISLPTSPSLLHRVSARVVPTGIVARASTGPNAVRTSRSTSRPSSRHKPPHFALPPFGDHDLELPLAIGAPARTATRIGTHQPVVEHHARDALARPRSSHYPSPSPRTRARSPRSDASADGPRRRRS